MSDLLPAWMRPKPVDLMGDYTKAYSIKTKFGMLGPVSSGKSTICAAIVHTCECLSSQVGNFYCRVLPTSTHILTDANNLCLGKFPKKTDPLMPRAPEAGFLLYTPGWRKKKVQVPICDVAGEITDYIAEKASGFTPSEKIAKRAESVNIDVVNTIRDCQGFIIALSAEDALMFRKDSKIADPDVYVHSVMNDILEYRRKKRRKDPHIILVLTKWDQVITKAKDIEMNVYDEDEGGLARFLANGFPATNMLLKPLKDKDKVKFFRSWFKIKQKKEGGGDEHWPETNQPVIDLVEDENAYIRFRPKYAERDYINIVRHIGSFGR